MDYDLLTMETTFLMIIWRFAEILVKKQVSSQLVRRLREFHFFFGLLSDGSDLKNLYLSSKKILNGDADIMTWIGFWKNLENSIIRTNT